MSSTITVPQMEIPGKSSPTSDTRNGVLRSVSKKGEESFYVSSEELGRLETQWYRQHGRYPESRIVQDRDGNSYPIGDWSWHRNENNAVEYIEPYMSPVIEEQLRRRYYQ